MKFKQFMNMYDNWNGITVVNDNNLNLITKGETMLVMGKKELWDKEVVAFGFYDNEFCVRIK